MLFRSYYEFKFVSRIIKDEVVAIVATQKDITKSLNNQMILEEYISKMRYAIKSTESVFFEFNSITKQFKAYNDPINNYDDNIFIEISEYIDITHPDDKEKFQEYITNMINGEQLSDISIKQRLNEESEWDYISITSVPFKFNSDGKVIKYVGFRRILTPHIKYQKTLEEYKTKMNLAIDNSDIVIWDYDCILDKFSTSSNENLYALSLSDYRTIDRKSVV